MRPMGLLRMLLLPAILASPPALAQVVRDAAVERSGNTLIVHWRDNSPVDVLLSDSPDADAGSARLISAGDRDGQHSLVPAGGGRSYFILRDTRSGSRTRVAERVIPLLQGSNFRDIGGYAGADGHHVRWGMIYRSGGQPMLTDADVRMVGSLGIANLIDLRSDEERVLAPTKLDGIPYNAIGYSMASIMADMARGGSTPSDPTQGMASGYRQFPAQLAPQVRLVFRKLLAREGPIAFNCSAGQDRTGIMTGLVLHALGVPKETIYADYLMSTRLRRPQWELPPIGEAMAATSPIAGYFAAHQKSPDGLKPQSLTAKDGTPFLAYAFDEIERRWGSIDGYLKNEIGLSGNDIAALRASYLE
jgi:protein-tyrosine phosphatase